MAPKSLIKDCPSGAPYDRGAVKSKVLPRLELASRRYGVDAWEGL